MVDILTIIRRESPLSTYYAQVHSPTHYNRLSETDLHAACRRRR